MASVRPRSFPFTPKSLANVYKGDFWGIPLSNGSFACGRVIQIHPLQRRTIFLAGLLDWNEDALPTYDSISGARCIDQRQAHLKTILENGRDILGNRALELDAIQPWLVRGAHLPRNSHVLHGLVPVRAQTPEDDCLPVFKGWGFKVLSIAAERRFVKRHAEVGMVSSECVRASNDA
jgi:hypothetical protein